MNIKNALTIVFVGLLAACAGTTNDATRRSLDIANAQLTTRDNENEELRHRVEDLTRGHPVRQPNVVASNVTPAAPAVTPSVTPSAPPRVEPVFPDDLADEPVTPPPPPPHRARPRHPAPPPVESAEVDEFDLPPAPAYTPPATATVPPAYTPAPAPYVATPSPVPSFVPPEAFANNWARPQVQQPPVVASAPSQPAVVAMPSEWGALNNALYPEGTFGMDPRVLEVYVHGNVYETEVIADGHTTCYQPCSPGNPDCQTHEISVRNPDWRPGSRLPQFIQTCTIPANTHLLAHMLMNSDGTHRVRFRFYSPPQYGLPGRLVGSWEPSFTPDTRQAQTSRIMIRNQEIRFASR